MKSNSLALCLLLGATAMTSCSDRPPRSLEFAEDPGRPITTYGPKCSVEFDVAGIAPVLDQCSAIATLNDGRAHLYLELYPDREPTGLGRYVSIVLPSHVWAPSRYTDAIGGRIEIAPADGRRYAVTASAAGGFSVDLQVDAASGPGPEGEHYLKGTLTVAVPGVGDTTGQVVLTARIN